MKGYFGIGVERLSKPENAGNLFRSAHAFGGSFIFTIGALSSKAKLYSDTSRSFENMPFYEWPTIDAAVFPEKCQLVGVELTDEAIDLPSFRHPRMCAYILGPERGSLSETVTARCDYVVKIPTAFCVNVSVAGAIVMYDRILNLGRFADRPLMPTGVPPQLPPHQFGRS